MALKPEYNDDMKINRFLIVLLVIILMSSCDGQVGQLTPTTPGTSFEIFHYEAFQVVIPDWRESPVQDRDSVLSLMKDGQFILINRYQNLPAIFATQFLSYVEEDQNAYLVQEGELDGKPFYEFTTRENNQTMRLQAVLDYCQGYTYAVVAGGRDTVENTDLFQQVLGSSSCQDPIQVPELKFGKIGMIVNPALDDPQEGLYPALRLVKENNVQVVHTYLQWEHIERTPGERFWVWHDFLLGYPLQEGFEVSLVIPVIHTAVKGSIPDDLEELAFDDPEFIQRFTDFVLDVLERYPVQYLSIGNEVNDYFVDHRTEIPSYERFFIEVKKAIQEQHPEVKVAMTFAYHDAEKTGAIDIIQQLNLGDFLPVTLYLYNQGFIFNRDPMELESYISKILDLAGDTPIAFAEIGWSTAESLKGSQEDQTLFLQEAFRLLAENHDQIEYLAWFALHDNKLETSYESALTFIPHRPDLVQDEAFMTVFVDFLNYMGLIESDGTPKEGWESFQEESRKYLEIIP